MARGEAPKDRPAFPGAAIFASFLTFCLCAITGVAMSTRECNAAVAPPAVTPEPFVGTIATFHALSWRDTERLRTAGTATVAPDAARARALLEGALITRGYTPATSEALVPVAALPADFDAPQMAGSCGVLVVVGDGAVTFTWAEVGTGPAAERTTAHDASVLAVPLCGEQRVHVEGTGNAAAHVWHYPGLTPEVAAATGLPVDVVLAHAEAETLLASRGLTPMPEVAVLELGPGPLRATVPMTRTVTNGCVPFVGVAIGAGDAIGSWTPTDRATDRALFGFALCATRTDAIPTLSVPAGTARIYIRPYRASGGTAPAGVSIGGAHVVREADLAFPSPPLVEAPAPPP